MAATRFGTLWAKTPQQLPLYTVVVMSLHYMNSQDTPGGSAATSLLLLEPLCNLLLKLPLQRWMAYDPAADLRSTVTVIAEFRDAAGIVRHRRLRGHAIYPLTGKVLVSTAQAMLRCARRPAGIRAASEMFASFERALELSGIEELPLPSSQTTTRQSRAG